MERDRDELIARLERAERVVEAARIVGAQYKITPHVIYGKKVRFLDLVGDDTSDDDKIIALIDALAQFDQPREVVMSNDDWVRQPLLEELTTLRREQAEDQAAIRALAATVCPDVAVRQFHEAFGVALVGSWTNDERRRLRRALIHEEFREYRDAEDADDPCATLDALVDMVYVIVGAALEYGFDFAGAFAAVHAANMAKLGPDGTPILRKDGKVLKPEGWKPADLTPYVVPAPSHAAAIARAKEQP